MKNLSTSLLFLLIFISDNSFADTQIVDTTRVYGVTIDAISSLGSTVTSLANLHYKPTTRIVFDEWQPATGYLSAVTQIHNVSFVMGEILDSYYMSQYTTDQYTARVLEYMNLLNDKVDIWEIGNEVNGEWLGSIQSVNDKISVAFKIARMQNKKTALTLYYNKNCWSSQDNEMFRWVNNSMPHKMRYFLDYVFISYYEDDCNNYQPNWPQVFDSLHTLFPNSKIGMGECGTTNSARKQEYIERYYGMNISTPNYVGGYFWWYFKQDCVPYTKPLWTVINNAMTGNAFGKVKINEPVQLGLSNYPNPFNPSTKISFVIPEAANTKLVIYDLTGREISVPVNEYLSAGMHEITWDAANFASGVYIYKLESGHFSDVEKMLLIK